MEPHNVFPQGKQMLHGARFKEGRCELSGSCGKKKRQVEVWPPSKETDFQRVIELNSPPLSIICVIPRKRDAYVIKVAFKY